MALWYIFVVIWYNFPRFWVCCTKQNLTTLALPVFWSALCFVAVDAEVVAVISIVSDFRANASSAEYRRRTAAWDQCYDF
jgi:hypothetical protein